MIGTPLMRNSPLVIATRRNPTRCTHASMISPSDDNSSILMSYRLGDSADHGCTGRSCTSTDALNPSKIYACVNFVFTSVVESMPNSAHHTRVVKRCWPDAPVTPSTPTRTYNEPVAALASKSATHLTCCRLTLGLCSIQTSRCNPAIHH